MYSNVFTYDFKRTILCHKINTEHRTPNTEHQQDFGGLLRAFDVNLAQAYAIQNRHKARIQQSSDEEVISTAVARAIKKMQPSKLSRLLQRLGLKSSTILSRKADDMIFEEGEYRFKVPLTRKNNNIAHTMKQLLWFKAPVIL